MTFVTIIPPLVLILYMISYKKYASSVFLYRNQSFTVAYNSLHPLCKFGEWLSHWQTYIFS